MNISHLIMTFVEIFMDIIQGFYQTKNQSSMHLLHGTVRRLKDVSTRYSL